MTGDNDNRAEDGVYEAMVELDAMPAPMDTARAVTRLRAHGTSVQGSVTVTSSVIAETTTPGSTGSLSLVTTKTVSCMRLT